ncbi:MAG: ectoine utilization protein EutC [Gammaproteobacteria bacterium]|nr:ectoine utilization protein EutC [Gammaproteobacteria bacterium]
MARLKILTEPELREIVRLDMEVIHCIESAFAALSSGNVVMPPILSMAIREFNGEVDVKTAYVPGFDSFAIKMSPGFFDNPKRGLPSTTGLMVLFSVRTGMLEAVLLDNGYLTDVRTAAAGAIAAHHLAPAGVEQACILGAGRQSCLQLEALCLVRPIRQAKIWARDFLKAGAVARELSETLDITVTPVTDLQEAVVRSDIVVTTTPSATPLVMSDWLRPGHHITAMGSDQAHKNELDVRCLSRADLYVPDRQSQTEKLGELHHALGSGIVKEKTVYPELGDIVAGSAAGRQAAADITICDLTGTGVQDTAIATFAYKRAEVHSAGLTMDSRS